MYAAQELETLTKKELTQIARDLQCSFAIKDSKSILVEKILESQQQEDPFTTQMSGDESENGLGAIMGRLESLENSIEELKEGQQSMTKYLSAMMKAIRMTLLNVRLTSRRS